MHPESSPRRLAVWKRVLIIGLLIFAGGAIAQAASAPVNTDTTAPGLGECRPLVWPPRGWGLVTCYQAVHVARAERVAPVQAINPVTTVWHLGGLHLTQVLILHGDRRGNPGILYVFGYPPTRKCPLGARCPFTYFVTVWEMGGRVIAAKGITITQTSYSSYPNAYVPIWRATTTTRGGLLSLIVDSSAGAAQVSQIAQAIVQAA